MNYLDFFNSGKYPKQSDDAFKVGYISGWTNGDTIVKVRLSGETTPVTAYTAGSYYPVNNEKVLVLKVSKTYVILDRVVASRNPRIQSGVETFGPAATGNSATKIISFPVPFATAPVVTANFGNTLGAYARWFAKAFSPSTTGCTLGIYAGDGVTQSAFTAPVGWIAVVQGPLV